MVAVLLAGNSSAIAHARVLEGTSYTTPNGVHTLEWTDAWTVEVSDNDSFSSQLSLNSQVIIYLALFIHDPMAGISPRSVYSSFSDVMVSTLDADVKSVVEWPGEDGSHQGAYIVDMGGIEFLLYMRVDPATTTDSGPTLQIMATPVGAFENSLQSLQADVLIDGVPALDGLEAQEVLDAVKNLSESESEAAATATAESPPAAVDSSSRSRSGLLDRIAPASSAPADESASPAGGGVYTSDVPPYTVNYPPMWIDMATEGSTVGQFSLELDSSTSTIVSFTGRTTTETNRDAYFSELVAREKRFPGFVGSVQTENRLITATWTSEDELAVLEYIFVNDNTLVTVMVTIQSPRPENVIPLVQQIQLEGDFLLPGWEELWDKN